MDESEFKAHKPPRKTMESPKTWKRYKYGILLILVDLVILATVPETGTAIVRNTYTNFAQMLAILPPVFILLGLLDTWVPREMIIRYLGDESGFGGMILSIVLGAAAAGPLYGAFPIAAVMMNKGAGFFNIIVFLGAWSTLKIPMVIFEMSALGSTFALTRWMVSLAGVTVIAFIIDKATKPAEKENIYSRHAA